MSKPAPAATALAQSCPNQASCPMFEIFRSTTGLAMIKKLYCESAGYARCERYSQMRKGIEIPKNLLPNGDLLGS